MACDIQRQTLLANAFKVDPGKDNHFGTEGGTCHILAVRADHATSAVEDEFVVIAGEAARDFKPPRQVASAHNSSRRNYEASPLKSVMPAGHLVHLFDRRPQRNVNVFASDVERLSRERHPVLPTDESANAASRSFNHAQTRAVSLRPDQPLGESRN